MIKENCWTLFIDILFRDEVAYYKIFLRNLQGGVKLKEIPVTCRFCSVIDDVCTELNIYSKVLGNNASIYANWFNIQFYNGDGL